jgi:hypothetical protein
MPDPFHFNVNEFMPRRILDAITEIRVRRPEVMAGQAAAGCLRSSSHCRKKKWMADTKATPACRF